MPQPISLLFEVFAISQRVKTLLSETMAGSDLRPDEYAVYSVLFDRGPSTPSEIARAAGMPPTTISHYVRAMLERRHATRIPHEQDGRSFRLSLTVRGQVAHRNASMAFANANRFFLDALQLHDREARAVLVEISRAAGEALSHFEEEARAS
jgi:DNA-binding MarR family transcriptional regulator